MKPSRSPRKIRCLAWPACSGSNSMNTYLCSASSHTASLSLGKNAGGQPNKRSYQANADEKSLTGKLANRSTLDKSENTFFAFAISTPLYTTMLNYLKGIMRHGPSFCSLDLLFKKAAGIG